MDYLHQEALPSFSCPSLPTTEDPTSIPLHCNICSKRPTFSDVSHLLTHIASKGHLSTYYKVKIKSATEHDARMLIDEYDAWYADYGIEALMSERMSTKETRRKQRARQAGLMVPPIPIHEPRPQTIGQSPSHTRHFGNGDHHTALNPAVKHEDLGFASLEHDDDQFSRRFGFSMGTSLWPAPTYMYNVGGAYGPAFGDAEEENEDNIDPLHSPCPSRLSHFNTSTDNGLLDLDDIGDLDDDSKGPEYSRLKGILWPGMDMFDSATPNMRRKRNQKKSADVIERLEALSRDIEATEVVYSAEGELQKARPITGYPHPDSSPLKGEPTPPPPRRQRRETRRKPLAPRDSNARPVNRSTATRAKTEPRRRGKPQGATKANNVDARMTRRATADKRDTENKLGGPTEASLVSTEEHSLEYLTSAFHYRPSSQNGPSIGLFRPAVDWMGYNHQALAGSPAYSSTLSTDSSVVPAWDFLGHDVGSALLNPLFMEGIDEGVDTVPKTEPITATEE